MAFLNWLVLYALIDNALGGVSDLLESPTDVNCYHGVLELVGAFDIDTTLWGKSVTYLNPLQM